MANLDTELLKPSEIAQYLGVSRSWIYLAARAGRIPCMRLGGAAGPLRFVRADVEQWLENARRDWLPGESAASSASRAAKEFATASPELVLGGLARDLDVRD
jgi:excisionase family DNA binding protein